MSQRVAEWLFGFVFAHELPWQVDAMFHSGHFNIFHGENASENALENVKALGNNAHERKTRS